jgi:hypothetical protein
MVYDIHVKECANFVVAVVEREVVCLVDVIVGIP